MHYVMEFSVLATILIMLGGMVWGDCGLLSFESCAHKDMSAIRRLTVNFIYTVTESGIEMESNRK